MFAVCIAWSAVLDMIYILLWTEGRIGRKQFWMGTLALIGAVLVIFYLASLFVSLKDIPMSFIAPVSVMVTYSNYCLFVKRLHDRGRNGRLFILYLVLENLLLFVIPTEISDPNGIVDHGNNLFFWVVQLVKFALLPLALYFLITCGFLKGTDGPNQYGRDPLK